MCLVHVATPLYTNHCFVSCKYKTLKSVAPKRQFCGSASNTKANSKERGSEKRPYDESPELHSSCNFCVVMVVSNGLRSTLILFLGEHAPRPPQNTALYAHSQLHTTCTTATSTLCVCPPSSISGSQYMLQQVNIQLFMWCQLCTATIIYFIRLKISLLGYVH